ncbi:PREDICTED: serine/threonine-protein phosphatase 7 long form homolog [Nicotiana attenuata]|uniref:serine/threonine-protein phosphatase 7 long form homolog n=1 Tax=Nicotiana attenuata TaxID=49451 RepID=UPI0009047234|nr:PREDICTED: serine/threonine-protein phosphatase 7 long form homolog [Nicotiana attenuata]
MIERWRLETHTFHLPIGEATITLKDVEVLFRLPVDGMAISYPQDLRDYTREDYLHMLQWLTEITDDSLAEAIEQQTRLLLLMMFGGILFLNTPGKLISLRFLDHLERLDELPTYNQGGYVLAYLYRQLCRSSMGTVRDVANFIPPLQTPLPPIAPDAPPPAFLQLARRWVDRRFIWSPYNDDLSARLPDYCSRSLAIWMSSVPLICLHIVEQYNTERVLR